MVNNSDYYHNYYLNNKDKILKKCIDYYYNVKDDPEWKEEYKKKYKTYYDKNRDIISARRKERYQVNKEKIINKAMSYYERNKETILQKQREKYHQQKLILQQ